MHKYANAARRKRNAIIATVVGLAVMIPAIFTFITVFNESQIEIQVNDFINNEIKTIPNFQLISDSYDSGKKEINLNFFNEVTEGESNLLNNQLNKELYSKIKDFKIKIKGSDTKSFDLITLAYNDNRVELQESKNIIAGLQNQITELQETVSSLNNRIEEDALNKHQKVIPFSRVVKDAKIRYNDIEEISFANVLHSKDFIKIDTIPTITIKWNNRLKDSIINMKQRDLKSWLQKDMNLDTLVIKRNK